MRRVFLSFFGAGFLKPAPGTWGSFAALVAGLVIHEFGGPFVLAALAFVLFFGGVWAAKVETDGSDDHDPSWIVIDEVVGQWIALLPVSYGAWRAELPIWDLWPGVVTAFLFFRLFDVWKPWLVGRADRRGDATGLMLDDVWAGIFAAIAVMALAFIAHVGFINTVNPA